MIKSSMETEGDIFRAYTEDRKQKKANNFKKSIAILKNKKIDYQIKGGFHIIVKNFDFYPSTGLFINRETKKKGRGIFNLLKQL